MSTKSMTKSKITGIRMTPAMFEKIKSLNIDIQNTVRMALLREINRVEGLNDLKKMVENRESESWPQVKQSKKPLKRAVKGS